MIPHIALSPKARLAEHAKVNDVLGSLETRNCLVVRGSFGCRHKELVHQRRDCGFAPVSLSARSLTAGHFLIALGVARHWTGNGWD
jgi:hypothetical protein